MTSKLMAAAFAATLVLGQAQAANIVEAQEHEEAR